MNDEKFWSKVDKSGECWIWTGARNGTMKVKYGWIARVGTSMAAHRWSWILHHGEIPNGLHVLHKCDNPPCVRPDHLWLGTPSDNSQDCVRKGRLNTSHRPGETNPLAKLTAIKVRAIRRRWERGDISQPKIAKLFGTCQANVSLIVTRKAWAHIK